MERKLKTLLVTLLVVCFVPTVLMGQIVDTMELRDGSFAGTTKDASLIANLSSGLLSIPDELCWKQNFKSIKTWEDATLGPCPFKPSWEFQEPDEPNISCR